MDRPATSAQGLGTHAQWPYREEYGLAEWYTPSKRLARGTLAAGWAPAGLGLGRVKASPLGPES